MDINAISAIVTGGASGIGEACARQLAAGGAKVVIADLNDEKGNALATEIGGAFAHVDVCNSDDIKAAIALAEEMGPLRALVNSAGIGAASRTIGKDGSYDSAFNLDYWKKVIDINLTGTFDCIRLVATARAVPNRSAPTASAVPSSTWPRWRRSTGRSVRPPTRRRRAAWWG